MALQATKISEALKKASSLSPGTLLLCFLHKVSMDSGPSGKNDINIFELQ